MSGYDYRDLDARDRADEQSGTGPAGTHGPAVCPNGHAMDDGLFECPTCGAYRPSKSGETS